MHLAPTVAPDIGAPGQEPPKKSSAVAGATLDKTNDLGATPPLNYEQLDTALFGRNYHSFAFHFENAGFSELCGLSKWTLAAYRRCVPRTFAIAEAMFENTTMRNAWGTQIEPGRWSYEKAGNEINARFGTRYGEPIQLLDILKHLTGRGGYARGTSDEPEAEHSFDPKSNLWLPNPVRVLRIDLDDDDAWRKRDRKQVLADIRSQKIATEAFGLPNSVFATGNRGVQLVAPLPTPVPPSVASVLMYGLRAALKARGGAYSQPCADNLNSIMRLPGGVHADTRALGMWMDPNAGRLYGIEDQARLLLDGFRFRPGDGAHDPKDFAVAARKIQVRLRRDGIKDHQLVNDEQAMQALTEMPNNPISVKWRHAIAMAFGKGVPLNGTLNELDVDQAPEVPYTKPEAPRKGRPAQAGRARDWAEQAWREGFQPGGFWKWINSGGGKGLLAARILFGDRAEEELIAKAIETPASSDAKLKHRVARIKRLCRTFREKGQPARPEGEPSQPKVITPPGLPDEECELKARELAQSMRNAKPKARWRDGVAYAVAIAVYVGIREGQGLYEASLDVIANHALTLGDGTSVSKVNAYQMLARMTDGDSDCIVPAFRLRKGNHWEGEADTYSEKREGDVPRWYS